MVERQRSATSPGSPLWPPSQWWKVMPVEATASARRGANHCTFSRSLGPGTRTGHARPCLLSARDDGNSGIRHSCAHMRGHARSLNPLARECLTRPDANCPRRHGCARVRTSNTGTVPQALTATVVRAPVHRARRGPSPRHHASADLDSVDSPSRSSANARGVIVELICTIATRNSHHHRVPSPCAEYHRPGKAAGGARFPGSPCDMTETAERHDPVGAIQSLRGRQQRHGLAAGRLVARPCRGRSKARRRDHSAGPQPRWRMDDCVRWEGAAPHAAVARVPYRGTHWAWPPGWSR